MFKKIEHTLSYVIGLISSTYRKNCESLGRFAGVGGDKLLRILNEYPITALELAYLANQFFKNEDLYLIIDDTLIEKRHSKFIAGTSDNYDSSGNLVYRSLCAVTAMVSNGRWALPIDHRLWINKEVTGDDAYISKVDLAKNLIIFVTRTIKIKYVVLDGLYATKGLINWLNENGIKFEMRFHSNRVITIGGKRVPMQTFLENKMRGKKRGRTVRGSWCDIPDLFFTAVKRENKNGDMQIVYQVSNYKADPRVHIRIYGYRWNIEKFFRTSKQYLGLKDCQSRKRQTQSNHIMNVFLAYALLIFECREKKLKNPEAALKQRKGENAEKSWRWISRFTRPGQIFGLSYA